MSDQMEKLGQLLQMLGSGALKGGSLSELCTAITVQKNEEYAEAYAESDYGGRIVLLPQCLRCTARCKAVEQGVEYVCKKCGACKIAEIIAEAERLGYMGVKILKGGAAVARLLKEVRPKAVLGVACGFEGAIGMLECERVGIAVQFVSLARDGCADTDVDLDAVFEAMGIRKRDED